MNREEIIKLIWERKQTHHDEMVLASDKQNIDGASSHLTRLVEVKRILNLICTPAELRKLQEGQKL